MKGRVLQFQYFGKKVFGKKPNGGSQGLAGFGGNFTGFLTYSETLNQLHRRPSGIFLTSGILPGLFREQWLVAEIISSPHTHGSIAHNRLN